MSTHEKQGCGADPHVSPPPGKIAVLAGTDIPTHTTAGPYPTDIDIGFHVSDVSTAELFIEVIHKDGRVVFPNNATNHWLLHVQPARDRHEQNVEVYRDVSDGGLHMRFIRAVSKGDQILAWYSDEFARQISIPILTPANIRGNQQYVCTGCQKTFLYPNSLKAHIHFRCNERTNDVIDDLHKPSLMHTKATLSMGLASGLPQRATLPPVAAFLANRGSSNPAKDSIQNWLLKRSPSQKLHTSELSAFKPHQKLEVKIEPDISRQPNVTRQSEQEALNLSVREARANQPSQAQTSLAGMSQPIQIFNHIHPPAFPISIDHTALRLYYPYLNPMHDQARICCGPMPNHTLQEQRNPCASQYSRHLLMTSPGLRLPPPTMNPHCYQNQMSDSGESSPSAMPYPFPMPSESEGEPLDLIPRSLFTSKSRKGHMCIYCGKMYSRKYGLKIHLRTHTGYKPLKCKVCLRPFGDPSNLNKHVRLHAEGDTPYRCQFCGKVLVRRRDLERHVRSRHPDEIGEKEVGDVADTTTADNADTTDREIVVT